MKSVDCCESSCVWCGVKFGFCWITNQIDHIEGGILYYEGKGMVAGPSGLIFLIFFSPFFAYCKVKYYIEF